MKPLITGDWHIRTKKPKNRLDDNYFNTVKEKIRVIFKMAEQHGCDAILQPGDMFDDADISDRTIRETLQLFNESPCPIFTVPGQHDLRHHSRVWENTPIGIADASWPVKVITEPILYPNHDNIVIYGAGYTDDIPEPDPDTFNILICHKLIIKSNTPFAFDFSAQELQKMYKYDLIVSGDNHEHFINIYDGRYLINCGSLLRTRIDQRNHKPCFYITKGEGDCLLASLDKLAVPVAPFSEVMNIKKAEEEQEKNEHLISFIEKIKETKAKGRDESINFKKRLSSKITSNKNDIPKTVISIIEEVMDDERWTDSK